MKVGIIGFISSADFDETKAKKSITEAFEFLVNIQPIISSNVVIVSGLTNIGILALAYAEATKLGFKTKGIACAKAYDHECFPCDEVEIVGEEWGDESDTFLADCDALYKFGGGAQSEAEFVKFTKEKMEFDIS